MEFRAPFDPRFKEGLLSGSKTLTSRTKKLGNKGDTFRAFGGYFLLELVWREKLRRVRDLYYEEEGCSSPEEFEEVWKSLHPRKGFDPDLKIWVHKFGRLDTPALFKRGNELRKGK